MTSGLNGDIDVENLNMEFLLRSIEKMNVDLRAMNSMSNYAVSDAPEIDHVVE